MTITNYKEKQNDYPVMKKIVNFLTAGLVDYSDVDDGKYLLRKEAIDRMLPTLEGRPLVIGHQKIDPDHIDDVAVGYITKGYWNPETGSFDCDVLVKDPEILNPSKNAVSCAYVATEFGEGGRYSGIDYDAEILNGEFTHIALVDNPRYNDAKILVNGLKKGANMMIKRFFSNADDEKKAEDKKENEEETKELSPEDVVTVGDKDVTIKELVDCYVNACKNEDKGEKDNEDKEEEKEAEDEEKKENEDEEKKDNECDEKKNEDSDDDLVSKVTKIVEKILAEKDKKNEDEDKKDNEDKEEKQNSLSVAAMMRDYSQPQNGFETRAERIAESNKKYGL